MLRIFAFILCAFIFPICGSMLESYKIIVEPAYFSVYGYICGSIIAIILFYEKD